MKLASHSSAANNNNTNNTTATTNGSVHHHNSNSTTSNSGDIESEFVEEIVQDSKARARDACAICFSVNNSSELLAVCKCYKKLETNRVHKKCLEELLRRSTHDSPPRCPYCGDEYQAKVNWNFKVTVGSALSGRACESYFEACSILITFSMLLSLPFFLFNVPDPVKNEKLKRERNIVLITCAIMAIMMYFVLRKIYQRWRKSQSTPVVLDSAV